MYPSSDAHDAIVPLLPLLVAPPTSRPPTPSPPKSNSRFSTPSQEPVSAPKPSRRTPEPPPANEPATQPHHAFLIVTLLSFLFLVPIIMTDLLPLRLLFFLAGAGSVGALHPRLRGSLSIISTALSGSGPGLSFQLSIHIPRLPNPLFLLPILAPRTRLPSHVSRTRTFTLTITPRDILLFLRHLADDDKLDDAVWNAPLTHVEVWENERWVQDAPDAKRRKSVVTFVREGEDDGGEDDAASTTSTATGPGDTPKGTTSATGGTWSKANLKSTERVGWTRGRDGWSGIGGEVRCVPAVSRARHAHPVSCTAATSRFRFPPAGRLSRQKAGDPT